MMLGKWLVSLCMLVSTVDSRPQDQDHEMCTLPYGMHYVEGCEAAHLMARRPKRMPSSGPRLIVVRARRLAGAWQVRALIRRWLPFPALAVYTAACRTSPYCQAHALHCDPMCSLESSIAGICCTLMVDSCSSQPTMTAQDILDKVSICHWLMFTPVS